MIRNILIIVFLLALGTPCFALEITFTSEAMVATDFITLGDVAQFDATNQLTAALATKVITRSPDPGENILLNSVAIKNEILRKTNLSRTTRWTGSNVVAVSRKGQEVTGQRLLQEIKNYLENNKHSLPQAEIRFTPRSLPLPFTLPEGKLAIEVVPSNPSILQSSRFTLIIRVDGKVEKNTSIQGEMQALANVVIAADSLRRGSILTPGNTTTAIKDLTKYDTPSTNLRHILGKRLKRAVRAQSVISIADVEIPPLVLKGQLVKIIINQKNMHISATGIAGMNGKLNELIRVRNARSNKLIYCRVAAPGIVEVRL